MITISPITAVYIRYLKKKQVFQKDFVTENEPRKPIFGLAATANNTGLLTGNRQFAAMSSRSVRGSRINRDESKAGSPAHEKLAVKAGA
jgi:hypothetical protein